MIVHDYLQTTSVAILSLILEPSYIMLAVSATTKKINQNSILKQL